jgi:hypothetical protein
MNLDTFAVTQNGQQETKSNINWDIAILKENLLFMNLQIFN